jgi:hypothetical protein
LNVPHPVACPCLIENPDISLGIAEGTGRLETYVTLKERVADELLDHCQYVAVPELQLLDDGTVISVKLITR